MFNSSREKIWIPVDEEERREQNQRLKKLTRQMTNAFLIALLVVSIVLIKDWILSQMSGKQEKAYRQIDNFELEEALDLYNEQFKEFMAKYGRKYDSGEETMDRFRTFMRNMKEVENFNEQKKDGGEYGENEMSDWTDEEFKKILLPLKFYKNLREKATFIKKNPPSFERAAPLPDSFDWRDRNGVSPVKAQGKCGSCWAFAATATVESAWLIKDQKLRVLSEQTLLDCDFTNNACDGGDEDKAFRFIHRTGLAYLSDLPYVAHRQNSCHIETMETTKIEIAYFLHQDEDAMIEWLVHFGPVNVGMSVTQPMRSYKCNTTECGVFTPDAWECKNKVIGLHALLVVGYGTDKATGEKYWIIKNSWGSDWGDHGFIKFRRGINACGIEDEPVGILA